VQTSWLIIILCFTAVLIIGVKLLCYFSFLKSNPFMKTLKNTMLLVVAAISCSTSFAQARLATAEYQKTNQPAVAADIPFPEKMVSKAIEEHLEKLGYRGKDTKGYVTYKGVHLPALGPDSYDLYFKTARKSKKEKDATTVTLMISSGYDKFIGDTTNSQVITNAKNYLDSLTAKVAAYDLEQQISEEDLLAKKSFKKLAGIIDDGQGLQKKKATLDNEIANNLKEEESQKLAANKEQQILQTLMGKRKQ